MRNTNIRAAIMVIAAFIAVLAIAAAVIVTPRAAAAQPALDSDAETTYKYIVRDHNGYVAVFPADDPENPSYVSRMPVALLPDVDRTNLEKGVKVQNEQELTMLLEDLTS